MLLEIVGCDEILCVDFKSQGYDGLMKCRTKEEFDEGEATFYKTSCFDLVSSKGVSLTEVAHKVSCHKECIGACVCPSFVSELLFQSFGGGSSSSSSSRCSSSGGGDSGSSLLVASVHPTFFLFFVLFVFLFFSPFNLKVSINQTEWSTTPSCPSLICFFNKAMLKDKSKVWGDF